MDDDANRKQQQAGGQLQHKQARRPDKSEDKGRQQQHDAGDTVDPGEALDQLEAARKAGLAAGVLHGMGYLVCSDRHRRDRAAIVVLRREADHLLLRIVVVARAGELDLDSAQPSLVEQVTRKLATGAGQIGALGTVARQRLPDPHLRAEDERQQQERPERDNDRHPRMLAHDSEKWCRFSEKDHAPTIS